MAYCRLCICLSVKHGTGSRPCPNYRQRSFLALSCNIETWDVSQQLLATAQAAA